MSGAAWRRHASPWSVYARLLGLPLLALAAWSRAWIGAWFVGPVALVLAWIWINPRLFPAPASTDNWASKAMFGERIWLRRTKTAIPHHHAAAAIVLVALGAMGAFLFAYGVIALDPVTTLLGTLLALLARAWFLDRMVWLFEDMMHTSAEYRDWLV